MAAGRRRKLPGLETKDFILTTIAAISYTGSLAPIFTGQCEESHVIPAHTVGCFRGEKPYI